MLFFTATHISLTNCPFDELSILLVHVLPAPLMWSYQIHGIHNTLPPSYGMFHILCQQQMVGIFFQYAGIFRRCRYSTVGTKRNGKQVNFSSVQSPTSITLLSTFVSKTKIENQRTRFCKTCDGVGCTVDVQHCSRGVSTWTSKNIQPVSVSSLYTVLVLIYGTTYNGSSGSSTFGYL